MNMKKKKKNERERAAEEREFLSHEWTDEERKRGVVRNRMKVRHGGEESRAVETKAK